MSEEISKESILKKLGLNEEQGMSLLEAAKKSPFEALMLLQTFNLDAQVVQDMMGHFMNNPQVFYELAESLGFSAEEIAEFKKQLT